MVRIQDPKLALIHTHNARGVRTDNRDPFLGGFGFDDHRVVKGDPFRDDHDRSDPPIDGFERGILGQKPRHKDPGGVDLVVLEGLPNRIVNRNPMDLFPVFAGGDAGNDMSPVFQHEPRVKDALVSCNPLNENACLFVDEYGHGSTLAWQARRLFRLRSDRSHRSVSRDCSGSSFPLPPRFPS